MKKILIIIIVSFILIQFFPIDKNNPVATPKMDFLQIKDTPEKTANLIRNSCYDCHSNESKYPWYANIQPFGWFLENHIQEGRKELNFSTFIKLPVAVQNHKFDETIEMVEKKEMPLESYTFLGLHKEANLTDQQRQLIITWAKNQMNTLKEQYPADSLVMKRRAPQKQ